MNQILPGGTIGVLGSGQLGRMFTIAARRMGYRVHTYSPDTDTPTGQVADVEVTAPYSDVDRIREFARRVDVVTFEFENVPASAAAAAAEYVPVRPAGSVLHNAQNRLREKQFLVNAGLPITRSAPVHSREDLLTAIKRQGCPAILKSAGFGYDGKGQVTITNPAAADAAWDAVRRCDAVLESLVDFEMEVSVIGARSLEGDFAWYGPVRNEHSRSILDVTTAPAPVDERLSREAVEMTRTILDELDVVGVLCVEFFVTKTGKLLVNELAPRPHNSGHYTFDASVTSQFEQQLRAVCGLPLGSTEQLCPAAMANLLGELWARGEPDWAAACSQPGIKLHLYGKAHPRTGRKMGHLTALGEGAYQRVKQARETLTKQSCSA